MKEGRRKVNECSENTRREFLLACLWGCCKNEIISNNNYLYFITDDFSALRGYHGRVPDNNSGHGNISR